VRLVEEVGEEREGCGRERRKREKRGRVGEQEEPGRRRRKKKEKRLEREEKRVEREGKETEGREGEKKERMKKRGRGGATKLGPLLLLFLFASLALCFRASSPSHSPPPALSFPSFFFFPLLSGASRSIYPRPPPFSLLFSRPRTCLFLQCPLLLAAWAPPIS